MNERIRELEKQATEQQYDYGGSGAKPGEYYSNYKYVLNVEKFAELMIQEFETVAKNPRWYFPDQQDGWRDPINCICKEMKKHFGVKQ